MLLSIEKSRIFQSESTLCPINSIYLTFPIYTVKKHIFSVRYRYFYKNLPELSRVFFSEAVFLQIHTKGQIFKPVFLPTPDFAQTLTARTFINTSFSAIPIINHTQLAQASIDGYVQGFPETTFLIPAPLPSEISHTSNALPPWHRS